MFIEAHGAQTAARQAGFPEVAAAAAAQEGTLRARAGELDAAWRALFASGPLTENPGIHMSVSTKDRLTVQRPAQDQLGAARPSGAKADIGAIELR